MVKNVGMGGLWKKKKQCNGYLLCEDISMVISKGKKQKKDLRRQAKKRAIKAFNHYIVLRDKRCVTCDKTEHLTCSHLISVTAGDYMRFLEINAHCQCVGCNYKHEYHPEDYTRWFIQNYGLGEYERLCDLKKNISKYTTEDFRIIAARYKIECDALKE